MLHASNDSLNRDIDISRLSPVTLGQATASLISAGLELIDALPDEPAYISARSALKEDTTHKIVSMVASPSSACPLAGMKRKARSIRESYEATAAPTAHRRARASDFQQPSTKSVR